jgi:uncharacterized protein
MDGLRWLAMTTAVALAGSLSLAEPAAARPAVTSLLELRRDKVVVQELDLSCAAAALATLLTYQHGDPVSEREVARSLMRRQEYLARPEIVAARGGFSLLDLKRYADSRGYEGIAYAHLTPNALLGLIPVIVPLSLHGSDHFVVVRGSRNKRMLLADPAWGNRTMTLEAFLTAWREHPEHGRIGFVVLRRDRQPPPNRLAASSRDFLILR